MFPSIRAGGISSSTATIAGRRWPADCMARSRGTRPRRVRSRHRQRLPRCRRRPDMALSRSPNRTRRSAVRKDLGLASLAMFAGGAFSANPQAPLRADASVLAKLAVADSAERLSGLANQSAGRHRWPRRSAAPPRRAGGGKARNIRQSRHAAARRTVRSSRSTGERRTTPGARDLVGAVATARPDLAVAADARRHRARRLLEASRRSSRPTSPTDWCRCTSSRNGCPIR